FCSAGSDCGVGVPCDCRTSPTDFSNSWCVSGSNCAIDSDCGPGGYCSPSLVGTTIPTLMAYLMPWPLLGNCCPCPRAYAKRTWEAGLQMLLSLLRDHDVPLRVGPDDGAQARLGHPRPIFALGVGVTVFCPDEHVDGEDGREWRRGTLFIEDEFADDEMASRNQGSGTAFDESAVVVFAPHVADGGEQHQIVPLAKIGSAHVAWSDTYAAFQSGVADVFLGKRHNRSQVQNFRVERRARLGERDGIGARASTHVEHALGVADAGKPRSLLGIVLRTSVHGRDERACALLGKTLGTTRGGGFARPHAFGER